MKQFQTCNLENLCKLDTDVILPDDDKKMSKHVAVHIIHCCDIYFMILIVYLLVVIKILRDERYMVLQ